MKKVNPMGSSNGDHELVFSRHCWKNPLILLDA